MPASLQENKKTTEARQQHDQMVSDESRTRDWCRDFQTPVMVPRRTDDVLQTVETEIIPRLIRSHRQTDARQDTRPASRKSDSDSFEVIDFANLLLAQDTVEISRHLTSLRENGASIESLYMELLSPAAQHLGCLWDEDLCSMIDVTLAVGRLHQAVRDYSPSFHDHHELPDMRRRALMLPMPGEQHTFGLSLVMEFFRRAGWDLLGWPLLEEDDLLSLVRNEWFVVIGVSVGATVNLSHLTALIRDLRRASSNPCLGIMVGGPIFLTDPRLAKQVGADATALDARQAVVQAELIMALRQK